MFGTRQCVEYKTTNLTKFHLLKGEKWKKAEKNNLVKISWREGILLCNICYMSFVENLLKKGSKRVKTMNEEEVSTKIDFAGAIESMAKILYNKEQSKKQETIYSFDEMRRIFEEIEPGLKDFFDQLYSAARPSERNNQTMDRMKKIMLFICYLLALLNNTKINAFKFDLAYYLNASGTSNKGLNIMANLEVTTISRAVNCKNNV